MKMAQSSEFGLCQINQIAINAHDPGRAVDFYRERLGVKRLFTAPKMAFFDCSGIRLMLAVLEKENLGHRVRCSASR